MVGAQFIAGRKRILVKVYTLGRCEIQSMTIFRFWCKKVIRNCYCVLRFGCKKREECFVAAACMTYSAIRFRKMRVVLFMTC